MRPPSRCALPLVPRGESLAVFRRACAALALLPGLLAASGCGKDHSWLALGQGGADAGAAGAGAAAGSNGSGSGGSSASSSGSGGTGGGIVEPTGPLRLTLVDGIVDSDAIRLCFAPYPDGPTPGAQPWPGAEGLPFARAVVVESIATIIPAETDVEVRLLAGQLSLSAGKTCQQLWTDPPRACWCARSG
jgi:hypothetical protein